MAPPPPNAPPPWRRASTLVGALLLAIVLALQVDAGPDEGPVWRRLWFDTLQWAMPRDRTAQPGVIVEIDERSLGALGQWPWPRMNLAYLIAQIHDAGAKAIALDVLLTEPDEFSPRAIVEQLRIEDAALLAALAQMPDPDLVLADLIRQAPVALALTGTLGDGEGGAETALSSRVVVEQRAGESLVAWNDVVAPVEPLALVADGFGAIGRVFGSDAVLRRIALAQTIAGRPFIKLGAEALRIAAEAPVARIAHSATGMVVDLGDVSASAETDGAFWLHFGESDRSRYISALDVWVGEPSAMAALSEKIVIVAVTALGDRDRITTPLGPTVFGVEVHLQMIEQIMGQRFLRRPAQVFAAELATTAALGAVAVALLPAAAPLAVLIATAAVAAGLTALGVAAFQLGVLLDVASPVLGVGAVVVLMTAWTFVERDRERLKAEVALARAQAASAKLNTELDAAWEIQQGFLPPPTRRVDQRLALTCHIKPARRVGGDFYDHFMIDERRLFFIVGDVSGKGIEASVFMGLSKALWKSVALREGPDLQRLQAAANREIARDNPTMMYVTGFVGLLDVETGALSHTSAGHEAPFILRAGAAPRRVTDVSGPPVGLSRTAAFPVGEATLAPGEALCVFSDGVTDAENPQRELYGLPRLERRLAALPDGLDPQGVVDGVCADIDAFCAGAEASDDLTLMVLRWSGPAARGA